MESIILGLYIQMRSDIATAAERLEFTRETTW